MMIGLLLFALANTAVAQSTTCTKGNYLVGSTCTPYNTYPAPTSGAALTAMATSTKAGAVDTGLGTSLAAAKTAYETGSAPTQKSLALSFSASSCSRYNTFNAYYSAKGDTDFLNGWISDALNGAGAFAATLDDEPNKEAISKGNVDQIAVMAALCAIEGTKANVAANWDLAYAYYHGDTPTKAIYNRADKRCSNYETCLADGTALVNKKVLDALTAGRLAATSSDALGIAVAQATFESQVTLIYYQAALRYAYLVYDDLQTNSPSQEHQAEGWAFWRVIEPIVAGLGESQRLEAEATSTFYNVKNTPSGTNYYCPLLGLLSTNLPSGVTAAEMGSLTAASAVTCPLYVPPTPSGGSGGSVALVGGVIGGVAGAVILLLLFLLLRSKPEGAPTSTFDKSKANV